MLWEKTCWCHMLVENVSSTVVAILANNKCSLIISQHQREYRVPAHRKSQTQKVNWLQISDSVSFVPVCVSQLELACIICAVPVVLDALFGWSRERKVEKSNKT